MDALHSALKKKIGELHHMASTGDVSGQDAHSALHDDHVGQVGHKPDDGKDPKDANDDKDDIGQAPDVNDDPMHTLEGGGDKSSKLQGIGHQASIGSSPAGHDNEMAILKGMSSGGAVGRGAMSLGERAKDKMKERMAAIQKEKK